MAPPPLPGLAQDSKADFAFWIELYNDILSCLYTSQEIFVEPQDSSVHNLTRGSLGLIISTPDPPAVHLDGFRATVTQQGLLMLQGTNNVSSGAVVWEGHLKALLLEVLKRRFLPHHNQWLREHDLPLPNIKGISFSQAQMDFSEETANAYKMGCTFWVDSQRQEQEEKQHLKTLTPESAKVSAIAMWALRALVIALSIQAGTLDLVETPPVVSSLPVAVPNGSPLPLSLPTAPHHKSSSSSQGSPIKKHPAASKGGKCAPAARYFLSSGKLHDCGLGLDGLLGKEGNEDSSKPSSGSKATGGLNKLLPGGGAGLDSLLNLGGDKGSGKGLLKGEGLSSIKKPLNDMVENVDNIKDSVETKVKEILPSEIKDPVSDLLKINLKELLLEFQVDEVTVDSTDITMAADEIQVHSTVTATIGGKGVLGPVISALKFESDMEVTMKIAISSNNTQCVNLDIQDTHIQVNEMKIQLIETWRNPTPVPSFLGTSTTAKMVEANLGKKSVPVPGRRLPPDPKDATISVTMSSSMLKILIIYVAKQSSVKMNGLDANITKIAYAFQKDKQLRISYEAAITKDSEDFATGKTVSAIAMWALWALVIALSIQAGTLDLVETPPVVSSLPVAVPNGSPLPLSLPTAPHHKSSSSSQGSPIKNHPAASKGGNCAPAARYFLSSGKLHDCKFQVDEVTVDSTDITMAADEIQVHSTVTATIGGKGVLGPVISALKFESDMEVTMKIAISSNNTQCVNLDIQDTHIQVNEMKIQLIETVTGTVPLPMSLPLNDLIPIVLSAEMNENVEANLGKKSVPVPGRRLPPDPKDATISVTMSSSMLKILIIYVAKQSSVKMNGLDANITKIAYAFQKDKQLRISYEAAITKDSEDFATGKTQLIISHGSKITKAKLEPNIKLIRSRVDLPADPTGVPRVDRQKLGPSQGPKQLTSALFALSALCTAWEQSSPVISAESGSLGPQGPIQFACRSRGGISQSGQAEVWPKAGAKAAHLCTLWGPE
ncbi:hypothetical protein NN561_009861 [Cricetulus griseus]